MILPILRTTIRLLVFAIILAVTFAWTAWLFSPGLIHAWLVREAASAGIEFHADIQHPTPELLIINRLHASLPGMTFTADTVQIHYTYQTLLAGRVSRVDMAQLLVDYRPVEPGEDRDPVVLSPWLLPVDHIRIHQLVGSLQTDTESVNLSGRVSLDQDQLDASAVLQSQHLPEVLDISVRLDRAGGLGARVGLRDQPPALFIEGYPYQDQVELVAAADLSGETLSLLSQLLLQESLTGSLRGSLRGSLPLPLPTSAVEPLTAGMNVEGGVSVSLVHQPDATLPENRLTGNVTFNQAGSFTTFQFAPGSQLRLGPSDTTLTSADGVTLEADLQAGRTTAGHFTVNAPVDLDIAGHTVSFRHAAVQVDSLALSANNTLLASGRVKPRRHPLAVSAGFDLSLDIDQLTGTLGLKVRHRIQRPLLGGELPGLLKAASLPDSDLTGGDLVAELAASIRDGKPVNASGVVAVADTSGHVDDVIFEGLTADLDVAWDDGGLQIRETPVEIAALNPGIPVTDIRFLLAADATSIEVNRFEAETLGGQLTVDQVVITDTLDADLLLNATGFNLASILELQGSDVIGTGTLDGTLPVTVRDGVPGIVNGTVHARAPGGRIRYLGTLPSPSPGLDLAARALRNFRYQKLDATLNYTPDGELNTRVRLEGSSPDVENGRAIHFNVNVNENLLSLLASLRAASDMQQRVQRQLSR